MSVPLQEDDERGGVLARWGSGGTKNERYETNRGAVRRGGGTWKGGQGAGPTPEGGDGEPGTPKRPSSLLSAARLISDARTHEGNGFGSGSGTRGIQV